jgi:hypothetical protein
MLNVKVYEYSVSFLVGGHDSMEDAVSCMELMHMKLKEKKNKLLRLKYSMHK